MSLEEKTRLAMEKGKIVQEDEQTEKKKKNQPLRRSSPKPTKLVVPAHIKTLFDNLDKSISSVWGMQENGKIKWDAKYSMWVVFKEYFKGLM